MKNIHQLLEKYWKGESSLKEEHEIKDFLAAPENNDHEDQFFFEALRHESEIKSSLNEDSFLKLLNEESNEAKVFSFRPLMKYAAILILPIALVFSFKMLKMTEAEQSYASIDINTQTNDVNSPEEAYEITMQALMFASSKMKKAEHQVKTKLPLLNKTKILK